MTKVDDKRGCHSQNVRLLESLVDQTHSTKTPLRCLVGLVVPVPDLGERKTKPVNVKMEFPPG